METNAQREAIAKACPHLFWRGQYEDNFEWNTDPLNDLNAMHEAEKTMTRFQKHDYNRILTTTCTGYGVVEFLGAAISATAAQRSEAFLRTLNLWTD